MEGKSWIVGPLSENKISGSGFYWVGRNSRSLT